jgi:hypothetical protein
MSDVLVSTEEEWLSTADPVAMVRHLRDRTAPVRKLQLLAAAGFRVAGADERLAAVPGAVERHADGLLGAADREAALAALDRRGGRAGPHVAGTAGGGEDGPAAVLGLRQAAATRGA